MSRGARLWRGGLLADRICGIALKAFLSYNRLKPDFAAGAERIAFWPAPANRKSQFRLETTIWRRPDGDYVLKTPAGKEAEPFIAVIEAREEAAARFFQGNFTVVRGAREQEGLLYSFLPYDNMEKLLAQRLASGDATAAMRIVNNYISLVHSLPIRSCVPEEFLRFIGEASPGGGAKVLCLTAGPIDLIPKNVLVAEGFHHLIDHEWFFDFPIPVDLVIFRGLMSMIFNLQAEIRANAGKCAVTLFSGYGKNRAYMPVTWRELFGKLKLPLERLNAWNSRFQQQVLLSSPDFRLRFRLGEPGRSYARVSDLGPGGEEAGLARWQRKGELAAIKLKESLQRMAGKWRVRK